MEKHTRTIRRQHRNERLQAQRKVRAFSLRLRSSLFERIRLDQPTSDEKWRHINIALRTLEPTTTNKQQQQMIAEDLQLLISDCAPNNNQLELNLKPNSNRVVCELLSKHPRCFMKEVVAAWLEFMNCEERQLLYTQIGQSEEYGSEVCRRLVHELPAERWAACLALQLLTDGRWIGILVGSGIIAAMDGMFQRNHQQPLECYQIVVELVLRMPQQSAVIGLLVCAFSNIHRSTECSLSDLMQVVTRLLNCTPWLISQLGESCQSLEKQLLNRLPLHNPQELLQLLKFHCLLADCCYRHQTIYEFDRRRWLPLSTLSSTEQQFLEPYFTTVKNRLDSTC